MQRTAARTHDASKQRALEIRVAALEAEQRDAADELANIAAEMVERQQRLRDFRDLLLRNGVAPSTSWLPPDHAGAA